MFTEKNQTENASRTIVTNEIRPRPRGLVPDIDPVRLNIAYIMYLHLHTNGDLNKF